MNPTQGKKNIENQPRSDLGWIYCIFEIIKCDQSNTVGAIVPLRWWVSAGLTEVTGYRGEVTGYTGNHLTSRMSPAESWMDRMWLMLCCTSSFSSPASVHQRKRWHLAHLLHPIYIKYSGPNANLRFFSPATGLLQTVQGQRGLLAKRFDFFVFLVWTERKTGKPMFLKQCSSLDQKQETGIVLIKFCSLKGSHFFYFRQMYILFFFSSCSTSLVDARTIYLR